MSMMDEIEKFMNGVETSINYRLVNLGGKMLYVEGIKSMVSFEQNEMKFQLNKQLLTITGNELKIKYLDKTTCTIVGQIESAVVK